MKKALMMILLLCSACVQLGSDPQPMRYYLLKPAETAEPIVKQFTTEVLLEPAHMPAYLDRPQLTTYNDRQQVIIAPLDRWAEPLEENFNRVLKENLSRYLQGGRISSQPWQSAVEKLSVKLTINSFDGILGQHTLVDIRWEIANSSRPDKVEQGRFTTKTAISGNYAELVLELNSALNKFSETLAREISKQL